jgi:hypothetical protein
MFIATRFKETFYPGGVRCCGISGPTEIGLVPIWMQKECIVPPGSAFKIENNAIHMHGMPAYRTQILRKELNVGGPDTFFC